MKSIVFSLVVLFSSHLYAEEWASNESSSYNEIIEDLESQVSANSSNTNLDLGESSFLDDIDVHGGVGLVTSRVNLTDPLGANTKGFLKGLTAYLGVDLFNPHWITELAFSIYTREDIDRAEVALKEFDLKFYYSFEANPALDFHLGLGLSSRYLDYKSAAFSKKESTPSSILFLGANYFLSPTASVRFEASYRKAIVSDTIDTKALNAGVSMSAFF